MFAATAPHPDLPGRMWSVFYYHRTQTPRSWSHTETPHKQTHCPEAMETMGRQREGEPEPQRLHLHLHSIQRGFIAAAAAAAAVEGFSHVVVVNK